MSLDLILYHMRKQNKKKKLLTLLTLCLETLAKYRLIRYSFYLLATTLPNVVPLTKTGQLFFQASNVNVLTILPTSIKSLLKLFRLCLLPGPKANIRCFNFVLH